VPGIGKVQWQPPSSRRGRIPCSNTESFSCSCSASIENTVLSLGSPFGTRTRGRTRPSGCEPMIGQLEPTTNTSHTHRRGSYYQAHQLHPTTLQVVLTTRRNTCSRLPSSRRPALPQEGAMVCRVDPSTRSRTCRAETRFGWRDPTVPLPRQTIDVFLVIVGEEAYHGADQDGSEATQQERRAGNE
jgi:hypothetical protein